MTLELFRFPDVFFRQTKKAYISLVNNETIGIAKSVIGTCDLTYNAIRLACRRKDINMDMRFCSKIYASWLRRCGVPDVMINFLQGRVCKSVLVKHYLTPGQDYKDRVLPELENLKTEIGR